MSKGSSSRHLAVCAYRHDSHREARYAPSKRCNKTFGVMWITLKVFFSFPQQLQHSSVCFLAKMQTTLSNKQNYIKEN